MLELPQQFYSCELQGSDVNEVLISCSRRGGFCLTPAHADSEMAPAERAEDDLFGNGPVNIINVITVESRFE